MRDGRIAVMQVIGTLEVGGAERMAVGIANELPRDRFDVHLCSTRSEGPLAEEVAPDIGRLALRRASRFSDAGAAIRLARYIRKFDICIVHCHQHTLFLCALASLLCPSVILVWHDHFGPVTRPVWLYRLVTPRVRAIIAVSDQLAVWARQSLRFAEDRVFLVRNFVTVSRQTAIPELPPSEGCRVVCVANLHRVKGILEFVDAMAEVVEKEPSTQALIVGGVPDPEYYAKVKESIADYELEDRVLLLGQRLDVPGILAQCDIGVLSSISEGLPLALIEYGMAGLAAVASRVGQCAEVLDGGRLGILVPPGDHKALADGILQLLRSRADREKMGEEFRRSTRERYGPGQGIKAITRVYDSVLVK